MRTFEPIAIVGRGCVLPGALDPSDLWARVREGADLTSASTYDRWGLHPADVCRDPLEPAACAVGGYVSGFGERFEAGGFRLPAEEILSLPRGWRWLMHASRAALLEAGIETDAGPHAGLIVGSLGYATREFADAAARRWCGDHGASDPSLAGQTGALHATAAACGLEGPRLALDAACASGLYALKIACDHLAAGRADVMLAAGLNCADDLFLHVGFTALGALSPSGRSSPLSTLADGLLPAEGAAVLVLKRLRDAIAAGDRILGVVRGVGLSNDGRGPGLLAPASRGQQRAMRAAYDAAGLDARSVEYLECHATGTPVGDREEVQSILSVYGSDHTLHLGSLKAQLGHLITASGTAALLKICGAFEHGEMPPAPACGVEHPIPELQSSALRLAAQAATWMPAAAPRRAAVNAFGFGGCNAHAIVDGPEAADDAGLKPKARDRKRAQEAPPQKLAIVACEFTVGAAEDTAASLRALVGLDPPSRRLGDVHLPLAGLGFPPADLQQALPQQLLLLRAAHALRPHLEGLSRERVGVFIGADVDPAGARHGCRWRLDRFLGRSTGAAERDSVVPALQAAGVIGTMPNMPANRLSSYLDAGGPGMTVSDGMASGLRALDIAADLIARGDLDAAVVGAVDASGGAFGDDPSCADASVLLLVMPASRCEGRDVIATLRPAEARVDSTPPALPWADSGPAHELLQLVAGMMCCRHGLLPSNPAAPWIALDRVLRVHGWEIRAPRVLGLAEEAPRLPGDAVRPHRAGEELAWVFTGAASAYNGAGRTIFRAFPELGPDIYRQAPRLSGTLSVLLGKDELELVDQLQLGTLVAQAQAWLLKNLGVMPDACLGISSGETNSLLASGAWNDADDLFDDVKACGMYEVQLAGHYQVLREAWGLGPDDPVDWRCYRVRHSVSALEALLPAYPRVRLLIVHHPGDCLIGGDDAQCKALLAETGARATPIDHELVVHCPEIEPFAETWYQVHHRETRSFEKPRIYANAINAPYVPTSDRCADMIIAQARTTAVFHPTVERAYADGVRCFIEIGPRAACTGWIDEILGGRPHVARAVDGARGSVRDLAEALAAIAGAGFHVDVEGWNARMDSMRLIPPRSAATGSALKTVSVGGHLPQPQFQPGVTGVLQLSPAPPLVSALADVLVPVAAPPVQAPAPPAPPSRVPRLAALAALAGTQQALLQAQDLVTQHLASKRGTAIRVPRPAARAPRPVVASQPTPVVPAQAPAVSRAATPAIVPARAPVAFTRAQLEVHASGRISEIFGPAFAEQDTFTRQVRMPMPPLLLADRVTDVEAVPASMGTGRLWTETDVRPDAWYLHHGRMPTGILIESGQADLFLISWLGVDLKNRGERVYRLLGCEMTFHGRLPAIGETLRYEIAVDGHARHGNVGLFFFHYDCHSGGELRLSVRGGQAGFFTDEELADSAGILWDPAEHVPDANAPLAGPCEGIRPAASYSEEKVAAFAAGDMTAAFGDGFLRCASHTRTPRIPAGRMRLFDRVDELDVNGGPWGRGYLRATLPITPDQWFFEGHFHNDPCMPGTLMFEGCLQTMAFYVSALGYSIDRDGWSFEPAPGRPYHMRCRGQVTPKSRELVYEVFVAELHDGAEPMLVADLMCTVDGLRAFHCRRMALRLTPDNPLSAYDLSRISPDREPVAEQGGFKYGQASLLACANGDPVAAFGQLYASLPPSRRVPRLPAPPYHFISRVTALSHPPGGMQAGVTVETAYDVPPDAWYFDAHPTRRMPACVLIEAALQPCGWLASYVGCAVHEADEVFFRNLDGKGVLHRALRPDDGCLRVKSRLKSLSRAGGMTLVSFDVVCRVGDEIIYELATTFGFFPKAALAGQAGLAADEAEKAFALDAGGPDLLELLDPVARARMPRAPLRMCERVTHREVKDDGRTRLRGEKAVRPDEWFFRSHFFQDPVQPGSLGVEALIQLLQMHLLIEGAATAFPGGAFADMVADAAGVWQFRGQVLPEASLVSLTIDAEPIEKSGDRWRVKARGSVWVDGRRIYELRDLTVSMEAAPDSGDGVRRVTIDPATQPWWSDHRPTYAAPVVPGMAVLDVAMASDADVTGVDNLVLRRWLLADQPRELVVHLDGDSLRVTEGGRPLAEAIVVRETAPCAPTIVPPLEGAAVLEDPYATGAMFHGPAYQRVIEARRDERGADAWLRVEPARDAADRVPHALLDAALHVVPHDRMETWFPDIAPGQIAYPAKVERFRLLGAVPRDGRVEARVRPDGYGDAAHRMPRVKAQLLHEGAPWAELVLVEACFPATRLGQLPGEIRRAYLRDGVFMPGVRLSDEAGGITTLDRGALAAADWLPGTIDLLYRLKDAPPGRLAQVAAKEHAAQRLLVHPREITIAPSGVVSTPSLPLLHYRLDLSGDSKRSQVRDAETPRLAVERIAAWWDSREWIGEEPSLRPLFLAACRQFTSGVRLMDRAAIDALSGVPLLVLANHQVGIGSILATVALPPVLGRPLLVPAPREARQSWVGQLAEKLNDDRLGPSAVYVQGEQQDDVLSSAQAMANAVSNLAILPVRFCRAVPSSGVERRLEFPHGMAQTEIVVGRPIPASEIEALRLDQQRERVLAGLGELDAYDGEPAGDRSFERRVTEAMRRWHLHEVKAVFLLLQADAHRWPLDADGLPAQAMHEQPKDDPFWSWFHGQATEVEPR